MVNEICQGKSLYRFFNMERSFLFLYKQLLLIHSFIYFDKFNANSEK